MRWRAQRATGEGGVATLNIEPNLPQPDEFYEALLEAHRDLDAEQSRMVNARLILLLANHIGNPDVLLEALQRARAGVQAQVHPLE
jgi:hypothetical protein